MFFFVFLFLFSFLFYLRFLFKDFVRSVLEEGIRAYLGKREHTIYDYSMTCIYYHLSLRSSYGSDFLVHSLIISGFFFWLRIIYSYWFS